MVETAAIRTSLRAWTRGFVASRRAFPTSRREWLTATRGLLASVVVALPLIAGPAQGQSAKRTAWGDPDIQGVWNYGTLTPLQRPQRWEGIAVLSEEEALAFEESTWESRAEALNTAGADWWEPTVLRNRRTSLVVDPPDGRIPPITEEARARRAEGRGGGAGGRYDNPENLALRERCIAWEASGPPMMPTVYNNNVQIVQTPDYVVLETEMIHSTRIVPINDRPHGTMPSLQGDPVGHWEGDTLVVETINFDGRLGFQGSGTNLRLIERFNATSGNTLEYRFTADDPTTWTAPWTAQVDMERSDGIIYEFACHEGNEPSLRGVLGTARYEEREQQ